MKKQRTNLFISVNPVGSKFAKALQQGLTGLKVVRCSITRGQQHRANGRKVFFVTPKTYDKITQLNKFKAAGVSHPPFVTRAEDVSQLDAKYIVARTLTNSTGGKGIVVFEKQAGVSVRAPLYTAYISKQAEYRVHVVNGKVIDVQQKKLKNGMQDDENRNSRIRNLANGWVYTRSGVVPPDNMPQLAIDAVAALGYEYGAVDIVWNQKQNKCFVLEVNSRPGLQGTTVENYCNALRNI